MNPVQTAVILAQIVGNMAHIASRSDMDPAARVDAIRAASEKAWGAVSHVLQALHRYTLTEAELMQWRDVWARGNGDFVAAIRARGEQ